MGNFKTLQKEMKKLQKQIGMMLRISGYWDFDDLPGMKESGQNAAKSD